jgi:thioester reductase-like protein
MSETVLLTGATGFVGMEALARLLERDDDVDVLALVRGRDRDDACARLDGVLRTLYGAPAAGIRERVRALPGDVTLDGLGLSDAHRRDVLRRVGSVLHCAASVSFALPLEQSRAINVDGARRVIELARQLPALRRVVHVSTAYVAGCHDGLFRENQLTAGQAFRNGYERSKYEAEVLIAAQAADLPLVVARPSIVVGETDTGWTPAFNVIYWPLQAFARGMLDRLPARPEGRVDVVPVDYVADALVHLLFDQGVAGALHLVAGEQAATYAELVELACAHLGRPRPRLVGPAQAPDLAEGNVFLPYFDIRTRFDDRRARALLAPHGIAPAPLASYFGRLLDYAHAAGWGERRLTRRAAAARRGLVAA